MNILISKLPWVSRLQSRPIPLLIGVVALMFTAVGFVFEYYRGFFSH